MEPFYTQRSYPELLDILKKNPFFPELNKNSLGSSDLSQADLSAGEILFKQGDCSEALYLVIEGRLKTSFIQKNEQIILYEIGVNEFVGEIQILIGGKHTADVIAILDTQLLKLSKDGFDKIVRQFPNILKKMTHIIHQRLRHHQLAEILPELLGSYANFREIETELEWVHLDRNDILFRQNDIGNDLYIVISGRLEVFVEDNKGNRRSLGEISKGETVGEMALLVGEKRTASVCALRDCDLVKLSRSAFQHISEQNSQLMMTITKILIHRLQKTGKSPSGANLAIIPMTSDVELTDFTHRLVSALSTFGMTLHLTSNKVKEAVEMSDFAGLSLETFQSIRLTTYLDEQENKYRFILYQADSTMTSWTKWCIERAEQNLLIANADKPDTEVRDDLKNLLSETRYSTANVNNRLILLHPNGEQFPSGTRRWLSKWPIKIHHHVRWDRDADFRRLARFLSGHAIGLVMGGGGARGFAHLGVYQALKEAGIDIDVIGGTSIGAFTGAECALGWDLEQIIKINKEGFLESSPYTEYTLPFISLLKSNRLKKNLKVAFDDICIEDMWLNFFCVSTNISTHEIMVHAQGLLREALRASAAIPGIAEPVLKEGELLIDGGILNNLPGDIMRRYCNTVIVVDVGDKKTAAKLNYEAPPSHWQLIRERLPFFRKRHRFPSLFGILLKSTLTASLASSKKTKADADFYLQPPVSQFKLLEFEALERLIEVGYEYTRKEIAKWHFKMPQNPQDIPKPPDKL